MHFKAFLSWGIHSLYINSNVKFMLFFSYFYIYECVDSWFDKVTNLSIDS